jgi:hypothetical protein
MIQERAETGINSGVEGMRYYDTEQDYLSRWDPVTHIPIVYTVPVSSLLAPVIFLPSL